MKIALKEVILLKVMIQKQNQNDAIFVKLKKFEEKKVIESK